MQRFLQTHLPQLLLKMLNSKYLNESPCRYGYINNLEAVSYEDLTYHEQQQPGMTIKELIEEIDNFNTCPLYANDMTVMQSDGSIRKGDVWDVQQLRNELGVNRGA